MKPMISAALLAATLLVAPASYAATVTFDAFSGPVGTASGTDGLGNSWTISQSGGVWLFKYSGTYNSSFAYPGASDFEVSIVPATVTLSGASAGTDAGAWSPTFDSATASVEFTGPTLAAGQGFLFAVDFVAPVGAASPGFTASWSTGVPEPSTWAMMGIGFAGLAFAGCRRSRKAASAAA